MVEMQYGAICRMDFRGWPEMVAFRVGVIGSRTRYQSERMIVRAKVG